jgi:hypothetical protein
MYSGSLSELINTIEIFHFCLKIIADGVLARAAIFAPSNTVTNEVNDPMLDCVVADDRL